MKIFECKCGSKEIFIKEMVTIKAYIVLNVVNGFNGWVKTI